ACLTQRDMGLYIQDLGSLGGTRVNGERVASYGPLKETDDIGIGPCVLRILLPHADDVSPSAMASHDNGPDVLDIAADSAAGREASLLQSPHPQDEASPCVLDSSLMDDMSSHRQRLHTVLLESLDLRRRDIATLTDAALREEASQVLSDLIHADINLPATLD